MVLEDRSFIGKGLKFPFEITTERGSIAIRSSTSISSGIDRIREALFERLMTRLGERVHRRTYGASLHDLIFDPITTVLSQQIEHAVRRSAKGEKRVSVENVSVDLRQRRTGKLIVNLSFVILETNQPGNLVFPFYLQDPSSVTDISVASTDFSGG